MMRSLFSAVSGLKTHQTRMDVIGNNIANVNTEAFKASSVRFSELMYQTMSTASGGDASTGTGGEIRDRMGGGVGSWPIAGTAVYMTAYPRLDGGREWEDILPVRQWLYQTPEQILIKASNGASDFGNKFGQPLITGSVLTFEHQEGAEKYAYDKVIMLAGGVGYGTKRDCLKKEPQKGNKVVVVEIGRAHV